MIFKYDFAVIGGDLRQVYIAELLIARSYKVKTYGLCTTPKSACGKNICSDSLADAVSNTRTIICPIPFTRNYIDITSHDKKEDLTIDHLRNLLKGSQSLFAGCIPKDLRQYGKCINVSMCDLMDITQLSMLNTISTAEGAIAEAIINSDFNLHESKCIVIGYGKCGRTLAAKVKQLCNHTSIYERNTQAGYIAYTMGYHILSDESFDKNLHTYDYIFNTAPAIVLDADRLMLVNKNAVIIDIASAPGGVDYHMAKKLQLNARLCPGLPGKYAPKASADAIAQYILHKH